MGAKEELGSLDGKCLDEIRAAEASPGFDRGAFGEWIAKASPSTKRNPSAYFTAAFRKAKAEGRFQARREPEWKPPEPPTPSEDPVKQAGSTIEEERESEKADYERILLEISELNKIWKELFPDETHRAKFTEPNDPRFDEHPSVFDGPYLDHPEYKANTYISVKREAMAEGTSMHEICRRKDLIYEALII